jgi:hypothetical protein
MRVRQFSLFASISLIGVVALAQLTGAQPSNWVLSQSDATKICPAASPGTYEKYRLPSLKELPAGVSFGTDWTKLDTGGWYGRQAVDACRIHADGFLTSHSKAAVRIEVQPGDDPLALKANSERAEMLTMQDRTGSQIRENAKSGKQFYATSYFFPVDWKGQQLPWSGFASTDCSTGNQNQCNSWSYVWQFYGWESLSAAQTAIDGPVHYRFNGHPFSTNALVAAGKWTDFVFGVDWTDGSYTIWRRDEGQGDFAKVLVGKAPVQAGREIYVKQGLYRGGNVNGRTDVLWIGPTARGSSFSDVERYAFGTSNAPD